MKKYWKDIESGKREKQSDDIKKRPIPEKSFFDLTGDRDLSASRRNFLKLCGFSFAVTALSSCESKISKAIPYVIAPEELTPGEALYYASSYINGSDYCSIIIKNRDGRPIKIEGNPESAITRGGTSARVQASVLELYDGGRFHGPVKDGVLTTWETIDAEIVAELDKISARNGSIVLLTPTVYSPSTEAVISGFLKKFTGTQWVQYDAISYSAILEANQISFGKKVIPDYRFDRAETIVSFGADFLGTWLSPIEYTKQFSSKREPEKGMNSLIQFESNLSLTGSNADTRIQIKPSQELSLLLNIYKEISASVNNNPVDAPPSPVDITGITKKLLLTPGKSLVISGSNNQKIQLIVNEINSLLGNIGNTILFDSFLRTHAGTDEDMSMLVERMQTGAVDALLLWNVNPAYTWYDRDTFNEGIKKVGLTVSLSAFPNETNRHFQYICPDNHYLESWGDAEAKKDLYSLMQPAIERIFDTRQMAESLLKWSGSDVQFYEFVKTYWGENLMARQTEVNDPDKFFDRVLQKGVFEPVQVRNGRISRSGKRGFDPLSIKIEDAVDNDITEIVLYETVALGEGRQSNNPWLQEFPDPVTRICWDNYASVSPAQAKELDLKDNDIININGLELPVHIQPGQAYRTIGIALGYGRTVCGKVGNGVGTDVWPLLVSENNNILYTCRLDNLTKTGRVSVFAQTQTHHSMEGRAFVREAALSEFKENPAAGI